MGIKKDNSIEIPEDISMVGWYKHGATPGSKGGSTVIIGHRDGTDPEPGAFYSLNKIRVKDSIVIEYSNYTSLYVVKKIRVIDRDKFYKIAKDIFSSNGNTKVALISCTGLYDKYGGGYQKNIIIIAEPLTGYPWIHYNIDTKKVNSL